jgi:hypothetical protein
MLDTGQRDVVFSRSVRKLMQCLRCHGTTFFQFVRNLEAQEANWIDDLSILRAKREYSIAAAKPARCSRCDEVNPLSSARD